MRLGLGLNIRGISVQRSSINVLASSITGSQRKTITTSSTSFATYQRPSLSSRSQPTHPRAFQTRTMASATTFYDFEPVDKKGQTYPLTPLKGKTILVVNTASKCGFTPQFEGLEKLYQKLKEKYPEDFTILGFPCNQFGSQDPGSNDDIQSFCQVNYGVTFPVLGKLDVNGDSASPLWTWMKEQQPGLLGLKRIKWNFEKFLISPDGKVVGRWASLTKPESLEEPIVQEIEKSQKNGTAASVQGKEGEQAKLA
ncbi:thioredoxin-like protein [Aspergillus avenaceus]|uniref:Glutathione peroxidase n=1 Tax=Aspergillus avenaceus TaxID=36643 RepID=A0A5N6TT47_ASPAV|nr:thioredoxin-like protein [Aspergillus avenaceus]